MSTINTTTNSTPTTPFVVNTPSYEHITSPPLIGSLLNFLLFGALAVQVYVYRVHSHQDALGLKFLVHFVFISMFVCMILNAVDVQYWFGAGFSDITRFATPRLNRFYTSIMGSFIGMVVQLYLSYRIIVLRRRLWALTTLIALISGAQCAGGMGSGILSYMKAEQVPDRTKTILLYIWIIGGATANLIIAVAMTLLLLKTTIVPSVQNIGTTVVRLFIEANSFSAITALISLILFFALPKASYYVCPMMILPGIYANTLLMTLINRQPADEGSSGNPKPTANTASPRPRGGVSTRQQDYSPNSPGRILSVPAMSFVARVEEDGTGNTSKAAKVRSQAATRCQQQTDCFSKDREQFLGAQQHR
ncbi:hypothetical protein C8J57DRAFT_679514 [Mycena rebaudengoi]|nr:hypothetical protein C8J57DRAFT_679514 [Mycena rebaudengoi]